MAAACIALLNDTHKYCTYLKFLSIYLYAMVVLVSNDHLIVTIYCYTSRPVKLSWCSACFSKLKLIRAIRVKHLQKKMAAKRMLQ